MSRFAQADTIVPGAGNPAAYDRYAYGYNNPVKYIDPSGHSANCSGIPSEVSRAACEASVNKYTEYLLNSLQGDGAYFDQQFGLSFTDNNLTDDHYWTEEHKSSVRQAVWDTGSAFSNQGGMGIHPVSAFRLAYGVKKGDPFVFEWVDSYTYNDVVYTEFGITEGPRHIKFASMYNLGLGQVNRQVNNVVHELGHAFDQANGLKPRGAVEHDWEKLNRNSTTPGCLYYENCGFASALNVRDWVMNDENSKWEVFADQFLGWVYGKWENSNLGTVRGNWMTTNMTEWLR